MSNNPAPQISDAVVEQMARFACKWADTNPDDSLGGDHQNFLWVEAAETLIRPLIAMLTQPEVRS